MLEFEQKLSYYFTISRELKGPVKSLCNRQKLMSQIRQIRLFGKRFHYCTEKNHNIKRLRTGGEGGDRS